MLMEGRPCSIREIKENIPENYWEKILYVYSFTSLCIPIRRVQGVKKGEDLAR